MTGNNRHPAKTVSYTHLFHNKQIKLFWFLRSFARYLTPKRLLQSRLDRVLAEAERRPDWEYICRRADYYNKLSPAPATPPREGLRPLGDHKFRRGVKTAYFFDTYEFTRWFSDRLLWNLSLIHISQTSPLTARPRCKPCRATTSCSTYI